MKDIFKLHVMCTTAADSDTRYGIWIDATKEPGNINEFIHELYWMNPPVNRVGYLILVSYVDSSTYLLGEFFNYKKAKKAASFIKKWGELGANLLEREKCLKSVNTLMKGYEGDYDSEEDFAEKYSNPLSVVPDEEILSVDYTTVWNELKDEGFFSIKIKDRYHIFCKAQPII